MVAGYVLVGTLAGFMAVALHFADGEGSLLLAILLFYATCTATTMLCAVWVALRESLQERRHHALALAAPVPALYRPGAPASRSTGPHRGPKAAR